MNSIPHIRLWLGTLLALIAFAANSVLGRLALSDGAVDPTSFTAIRLWSGAVLLFLCCKTTSNKQQSKGSWRAALMLFLYATCFSYAYRSIEAGTGALILFGAVQLTTVVTHWLKGNKLHPYEALGMALACLGFFFLVKSDISAPSLTGAALMLIAGVAWALYTLLGRNSTNPISDTSSNFIRCIPLTIPLVLFSIQSLTITTNGLLLAIVSGGVTSGLGYAIWYSVLRHIKSLSAAVLQLLVPVLAVIGGILFTDEKLTIPFLIASCAILCGALIVILAGQQKTRG